MLVSNVVAVTETIDTVLTRVALAVLPGSTVVTGAEPRLRALVGNNIEPVWPVYPETPVPVLEAKEAEEAEEADSALMLAGSVLAEPVPAE